MGRTLTRNGIEVAAGITLAVMWIIGSVILQRVLPQYDFQFYPVIPLIFLVFSIVNAACIRRWEKAMDAGRLTHRKVSNYFMIGKMIKMLVCVVVIFCYLKFIGDQKNVFLLCFLIYYMVFLYLETLAYYGFEKRYKAKKENSDINK